VAYSARVEGRFSAGQVHVQPLILANVVEMCAVDVLKPALSTGAGQLEEGPNPQICSRRIPLTSPTHIWAVPSLQAWLGGSGRVSGKRAGPRATTSVST
jgi:hypothetical protein